MPEAVEYDPFADVAEFDEATGKFRVKPGTRVNPLDLEYVERLNRQADELPARIAAAEREAEREAATEAQAQAARLRALRSRPVAPPSADPVPLSGPIAEGWAERTRLLDLALRDPDPGRRQAAARRLPLAMRPSEFLTPGEGAVSPDVIAQRGLAGVHQGLAQLQAASPTFRRPTTPDRALDAPPPDPGQAVHGALVILGGLSDLAVAGVRGVSASRVRELHAGLVAVQRGSTGTPDPERLAPWLQEIEREGRRATALARDAAASIAPRGRGAP